MREPLLILAGLIIFMGLAYGPLKNVKSNGGIYPAYTNGGSYPAGNGPYPADQQPDSKAAISDQIKSVQRSVKSLESEIEEKMEESRRSPYHGKIRLSSIIGLYQSDPDGEYFILFSNLGQSETVKITGWLLKSSVTGNYAYLGGASLLPYPSKNSESDVVLRQGDTVYITKGFSPIGISFRTNKCTGYFEENRTFVPSLPLNCPRPSEESLPQFSTIYDRQDECVDLLERIPRCTTKGSSFIRDLPDTVTQSCKNYILRQVNYDTCVSNHFGDVDFPGNEYRLYLKTFGPLWRTTHDKITLYDSSGLIVDSISY